LKVPGLALKKLYFLTTDLIYMSRKYLRKK